MAPEKMQQPTVTPGPVPITTEYIKLDSFMKLCGISDTGGDAKWRVQQGYITVNGNVCTQRGRKLRPGDRVGNVNNDMEFEVVCAE